jgi:hypothetical protein
VWQGDLLGLRQLTRQERIALGAILDGAQARMTHAATCLLSDYRERYMLLWYRDLIAETAEIAAELRKLPPRV